MPQNKKNIAWAVLICLVVPMFASYFFDDMFSTVSHLFKFPDSLALGWDSKDLGDFIGDYSLLCVCGGLVIGGILLDVFGVRIMGSVFVGMMVLGAAMVFCGLSCGMDKSAAIALGRIGRMFFGLGSEIAGVAVTRSIAKWFRNGRMSLAMGLQLAIARSGTAVALITAPLIVGVPKEYYTIADTSRPALIGLILMAAAIAAWALFAFLDGRSDKSSGITFAKGEVADEDRFKLKDITTLLKNVDFVTIGLLCVTFYCCVSSFKKFGTCVVIPRFSIEDSAAGMMVAMIPFFTIIFTPLFGALVDKMGHGARWMILGSGAVLGGHALLAFAPGGTAFYGYAAIALLGLGYSLVPSAMWPAVPRIVPQKCLGTAYSLIYWIQNVGLFFVPKIVGRIFSANEGIRGAVEAEWLFLALAAVAVILAIVLLSRSEKNRI